MDLSPAEEVVIGLLRGEYAIDFTLNVAWLGPVWTVSLTTEGDGILAGRGETFRQAIQAAFSAEGDPGDGDQAEPTLRPALRIVGGSHDEIARAGSAGEVQPAVTEHRQRAPGPFSRVSPQQRPAGF